MKLIFSSFLLVLSILLSATAFAQKQPTAAEIQAILDKTKRLVDSIGKVQQSKLAGMRAEPRQLTATPLKPDTNSFRPPPRNTAMLGAIPKQTLSADELKSFVGSVDKKLTAILKNEGVALAPVDQIEAGTLCQAAMLELLQGGSKQTAWLVIKAIEKAPGNVVLLNNCGAILNGCGFQPVAIPVLETALEKSPGNSSIQNNLGQAYIALGEPEKATMYLQQCIKKSPVHPHANFALACIYHGKGDDGNALTYAENSLRGAFSDGAWRLLSKLKKDPKVLDYIKDRYKPAEYFDEDKYHLPMQCESVADVPAKRGEYTAYQQSVQSAKKQMNDLANDEFAQGKKALQETSQHYQPGTKVNNPVFNQLAAEMLLCLTRKMTDEDASEISKQQNKYKTDIKNLQDEYARQRQKVDCAGATGLANDYMEKMAIVTRTYQKAYLRIWKDFYNENSFWSSLSSGDPHIKKALFCKNAASLLAVLSQLGETHFLTGCDVAPDIKKDTTSLVPPVPDCPIDIHITCKVGNFHLDCEKIEFDTKIGLLLNIDHSFSNHRTTIMIGAGEDLKFKRSVGPIEGELKTAGYMKFFLSFDGTRVSDQGLIWNTSITYKQEITNDFGLKSIPVADLDLGAETTLSIANGWTFKGSLYDKIDEVMGWTPSNRK